MKRISLLQLLISLSFAQFCVAAYGSNLTRLPDTEVQALQKISTSLGVNWDFSVDPCSGDRGWVVPMMSPLARNVTCDCTSTQNLCHIVSIQLKGLNLRGVLPEEFAILTSLKVIDLTWNYLYGSLPVAWASLPLTNLSLIGNRISGSIPEEFGRIATFRALVLEDNQLEGPLPRSLGNLVNLDRLVLAANNFTGQLPDTLGNLRNLTDFGYMAPEYAMRGYLTDKADVYSFGVVTLEIVSGKSNTNFRPKEECMYLLDWAYVLQEHGRLLELVDPTLRSNYSKKEAIQMLNLSLLCTNPSPTLRPTMSSVVSMLEGRTPAQVPSAKQAIADGETLRFKAFEKMLDENATQDKSMDGPSVDSSVSANTNNEKESSTFLN